MQATYMRVNGQRVPYDEEPILPSEPPPLYEFVAVYRVQVTEGIATWSDWLNFSCMAESEDHAIEQCLDAYPDALVCGAIELSEDGE